MSAPAPSSSFLSAPDGLRLHVRGHGQRSASALPVLCLPGLARTAEDFDALAEALANDATRPRRVIALDYRGRGQSAYDRNPANYSFQTEIADVLAAATALDCLPAIVVGTSRGGILAMLLAALRPSAITRRGQVASLASASASASKSSAVRASPGRQSTGKALALRRPWPRACSRNPSGAEMKVELGAEAGMAFRGVRRSPHHRR